MLFQVSIEANILNRIFNRIFNLMQLLMHKLRYYYACLMQILFTRYVNMKRKKSIVFTLYETEDYSLFRYLRQNIDKLLVSHPGTNVKCV